MTKKHYNRINQFVYPISMAILIVLTAYLIYANYSYSRQIEENNRIIDQLMLNTSLTKDLFEERIDSTGKYYIRKYLINTETQKPVTYNELDSLYHIYREQSEVYETIILQAKKYYQFDYSYKISGDTITTQFWPKSQTKLIFTDSIK